MKLKNLKNFFSIIEFKKKFQDENKQNLCQLMRLENGLCGNMKNIRKKTIVTKNI